MAMSHWIRCSSFAKWAYGAPIAFSSIWGAFLPLTILSAAPESSLEAQSEPEGKRSRWDKFLKNARTGQALTFIKDMMANPYLRGKTKC